MVIGGWEGIRVVSSPLVFQATLLLLLLPSLLVGGLAILGPLVSRIPSRQGWGFGTLEGVLSRIPSGGGLGLGHSSVSGAIPQETLIYLFEYENLEAIDRFLRLVRPNCLAPSRMFHLGLDRRLTSFSKESNEVGLFWSSVSIKLDGLRMLEVRRPIVNFLCSR